MKKLAACIVALALIVPFAIRAHADHGDKEEAKETMLKGEVIDLGAYLAHSHRGPEHAEIAETAIRGGAPGAIVTEDGTVYVILVGENEGREPLKYIAHNVEISGIVHERGGSKGVLTKSVKDLGAAPAPK